MLGVFYRGVVVRMALNKVGVEALEEQLKAAKAVVAESTVLRVHRALSWLMAAVEQSNEDQRLINLSIALNALMQQEDGGIHIASYTNYVVASDTAKALYPILWQEYPQVIRTLIKNPYLYDGFWLAQRESQHPATSQASAAALTRDWQAEFNKQSVEALNALSRKKEREILMIIFSRLAVLQEQVMAGGATWKSQVNRQQVTDGANLLAVLLPHLIQIMLKAESPWGAVAYPVVNYAGL